MTEFGTTRRVARDRADAEVRRRWESGTLAVSVDGNDDPALRSEDPLWLHRWC